MSFVLPGNSRQLRFTGEAKAHAPANGEPQAGTGSLALGKPRVRKPPPPPPARVQTPVPSGATRVSTPAPPGMPHISTPAPGRRLRTPVSRPDLYRNEIVPTPYMGAINPPVVRHREDDFEDESPTMAMDRDGLDVLPGARALRTPKPTPAAGAPPIPHFRPARPAASQPRTVIVPGTASSKVRATPSGAPLAVWVFAGLLAGIVSYHVAPEIMARLEHPAAAAQNR